MEQQYKSKGNYFRELIIDTFTESEFGIVNITHSTGKFYMKRTRCFDNIIDKIAKD